MAQLWLANVILKSWIKSRSKTNVVIFKMQFKSCNCKKSHFEEPHLWDMDMCWFYHFNLERLCARRKKHSLCNQWVAVKVFWLRATLKGPKRSFVVVVILVLLGVETWAKSFPNGAKMFSSGTKNAHEWMQNLYGNVWPRVALCGLVWPRVALCGLVWPLQQSNKRNERNKNNREWKSLLNVFFVAFRVHFWPFTT